MNHAVFMDDARVLITMSQAFRLQCVVVIQGTAGFTVKTLAQDFAMETTRFIRIYVHLPSTLTYDDIVTVVEVARMYFRCYESMQTYALWLQVYKCDTCICLLLLL